jgi:general secretion pathway protein C
VIATLPVANAQAAEKPLARPTADAILDRNPFDHVTGPLRFVDGPVPDPWKAPSCAGVRPLVLVASDDPHAAFAALEVKGKRIVRRTGGDVDGMRVAYIGHDSVWLESAAATCQARLFAPATTPPPPAHAGAFAGKIERVSETEFRLDRGALDMFLDAQTELMKLRLAPEPGGVKVLGVKPGSAVAMLGIENGDRLESIAGIETTSPEKLLELYARLKSGTIERLSIHLVRAGRPLNVDYVVR